MNWSRTKTWLIVLFVGLNLFLIFTIVKDDFAQSTISEQMVTDTVAVLNKNGISVEPASIQRKMPALSSVEVLNTVTDPAATAEKLLGGEGTYDAETQQYTRGTAAVRIVGDSIDYTNPKPAQQPAYETQQAAVEYVKRGLSEAGFDVSKAQTEVLSYTQTDVYLLLTQMLDSYPLLDSQFLVHLTAQGVTELSGCWFYMAEDQFSGSGAHGRVKEITSVLIDFISDENRANTSTQITDITLGYTTGDKTTYHKSVSAMPAWRICTSDGRVYHYDAH